MYGLPALTLLFTWWLPAALQLSFFVSGVLSYGQASLLRLPKFRQYFNMTPLPQAGPTAPTTPYKGNLKIAATSPAPISPASPGARRSAALSTSELNSRFEATAGDGKPTSIFSGALKKISDPIKDVTASGRAMVGKATESMETRREKAEIKQREAFEAKRREEDKKARWARQEDKRLEREAKAARAERRR